MQNIEYHQDRQFGRHAVLPLILILTLLGSNRTLPDQRFGGTDTPGKGATVLNKRNAAGRPRITSTPVKPKKIVAEAQAEPQSELGRAYPQAALAAPDQQSELAREHLRAAIAASEPVQAGAGRQAGQAAPAPVVALQPAVPPTNVPTAITTNAPPQPGTNAVPLAEPKPPTIVTPEIVREKKLYSFRAENLELKTALALFARANRLNIVPDQDIAGQVTLDVQDLPLEQMMSAILDAHDYRWYELAGLIRIRSTETRQFAIDYLRLSRTGIGKSNATLGSGGMGGGGGGGAGGGGAGGGGGGGASGGGGGGGTAFGGGSSSVNLTADNAVDFWKELTEEVGLMLTPAGKTSLSVNKTAGIIQIVDRPSALKRVEEYLSGVKDSIHRQVEIEARLYDVTLSDQFQFGIDWVHVAKAYGGALATGGATLPTALGGAQLQDSALGGLNRFPLVGTSASVTPGGNPTTLVFQNFNTTAAVNALRQQGRVEVISTPRIRTLNNQTALIKVGEEVPFFNSVTTFLPGTITGTSTVLQQTVVTSITIGTILSITPQISSDDWISLDISPVLTSLKAVVSLAGGGSGGGGGGGGAGGGGGGGGATAPDLDTKQASTLVRVRDGTTVVLGGLIQTEKAESKKKIPVLGDIPLLGKLFTGTLEFNQKKELVIFVTPRIVR